MKLLCVSEASVTNNLPRSLRTIPRTRRTVTFKSLKSYFLSVCPRSTNFSLTRQFSICPKALGEMCGFRKFIFFITRNVCKPRDVLLFPSTEFHCRRERERERERDKNNVYFLRYGLIRWLTYVGGTAALQSNVSSVAATSSDHRCACPAYAATIAASAACRNASAQTAVDTDRDVVPDGSKLYRRVLIGKRVI